MRVHQRLKALDCSRVYIKAYQHSNAATVTTTMKSLTVLQTIMKKFTEIHLCFKTSNYFFTRL